MQIKYWMLTILVTLQLSLVGCSLWSDDEAAVTTVDPMQNNPQNTNTAPSAVEETELKIAKLWNRVDELEDALSKQRQRMAVLERGLLLGVIPDELKNPVDLAKQKDTAKDTRPTIALSKGAEQKNHSQSSVEHVEQSIEADVPTQAKSSDTRQKNIQEAQQFFEQGQYGRAIALYSAIDDASDPELTHRYWTALSWYRLKEYDTAQKEFNELVQRAAASQWVPRAHYYLAQIDLEQGLREQGLSKLQKLIELHPDADAAQMARSTIAKLEKNL